MSATARLVLYALAVVLLLALPGSFVAAAASAPPSEWKAPARAAKKKNPIPADAASIALGKKLYAKECASCHGAKGLGDGPSAKDLERPAGNLADPKMWKQTDGELYWKTTEGNKPMPNFGQLLSDEQRWHIVNYLRTLAAKPPSAAP